MAEVRQFFRPEFLNRLDDIVLFSKLGFSELHDIVDSALADVNARLKERRIAVLATPAAKDFVLEQGYDPDYGARPLKRWIEKNIVTEISRLLISGALSEECELTVHVNSAKTKLNFTVKRKNSA